MKKIVSILMAVITVCCCLIVPASASQEYPVKRENVHIRDPYVLAYEGKYYMYGTCLSVGEGYGCVVSEDLENWSEKIQVFSPSGDFDGYADYWAPECHYYEGSFYLFATYRSRLSEKRGTAVFKSDSPTGPFELISDGHVTPKNTDCIDGTLYVDDDGQPWMVFVNEWTSSPDGFGEMSVAKLSDDLTHFVSEPERLFRSNKHVWTNGGITDGPFVYKTEKGRLIMLWSNGARSGGYSVGMAVSDNGRPDGDWLQFPKAVYKRTKDQAEGGHAMLFKTFDGQLMMAIHSPNGSTSEVFETAKFIPVEDTGKFIRIQQDRPLDGMRNAVSNVFFNVYLFALKVLNNVFNITDRALQIKVK